MRVWIFALGLGLAAATTFGSAVAEPSTVCRDRGQAALTAWMQGDDANVTKDFAPDVAAKLSPERLKQVWAQLQVAAGGFKQQLGALQPREVGRHALWTTELQFSNVRMAALVGCDEQNRITTFRVVPAASAPTVTSTTGIASELDVPTPLGPLPGTLVIPRGKGPFPAVLLLAGSGPGDRDATIGPNKPLRDVAEGLAAKGIASLRFDKRTHVYAEQVMRKDRFTVDDEVTDDALSALRRLAEQPAVDPHRLFVLGHSLGAFMAPRVARRDGHVAGAILMAAPATVGLDTVIRQTRYLATLRGVSPEETDAQLAQLTKARDMMAHADAAHPPAGMFFHAPASYWLSLREYDAIATAKTLHVPLLILQGEGDYQVTPQDDFSRWQAAFGRDPRAKLIEYPGLSHLFMPAGQPPSPADYAQPGHVDAHVIDDIAAWIDAQPAAH